MAIETRIALLGHKDHGKSTFIGRLLHDTGSISKDRIEEAGAICASLGKEFEYAFLLDSFVEEREGGFTLDTTSAQARHDGMIYNLIDVPGHKELVKNMLSGASMADSAVLIVSAKGDEGLQDETRLHIFLARLLGIRRLVVAVNKMDSVSYGEGRFEEVKRTVSSALSSSGFEPSELSFVPVSAMKGDNMMERSASMEWYGGPPVIRLLEDMAREQAAGRLVPMPGRMFIQDVYPDDGKEMLVGKVETGLFRAGDKVKLWPPGTERRIEAIHGPGGKMLDSAAAGQNIGLTLDGGGGIARGAVCMGGDAPGPAGAFRARIFCLPEGSIEAGAELFLGRASESVGCSVKEIEKRTDPVRGKTESGGSRVGPCESADVLIETARPMVFERFSDVPPMGRFVLSKGGRIAAVGVVL